MKAQDIVLQLATQLPKHTDKFTTNAVITSLTQTGGVATAVTATAHGLSVGSQTNIVGALAAIQVTSLTRSGTVGTAVLTTAHDFTTGEGDQTTIELTGATEAEFNGTFTILTVPNRTTVTFVMADAGATVATGIPLVLNGSNVFNQYNGLREVLTVPDTTSFTFAVPSTLYSPAFGSPESRGGVRVSAVVEEDVIFDAYTKQLADNYWAFVVLGDVVASNSRNTESDAVSDIQRGDRYRQRLIQTVTVYVNIPAKAENAGRSARDACEDLFPLICRSMLFKPYDSGLAVGTKGPLQFTNHGFAAYNRAYYVHAYAFQQVVDLTYDDTVGDDDSVAFRDIALDMKVDPGTLVESLTAGINLDEDSV